MMSFPFPEPTPEEVEKAKREALDRRTKTERKLSAALPHLKEAQRSLREAAAFNLASKHFYKTQKHLAILIDQLETELVRTYE